MKEKRENTRKRGSSGDLHLKERNRSWNSEAGEADQIRESLKGGEREGGRKKQENGRRSHLA